MAKAVKSDDERWYSGLPTAECRDVAHARGFAVGGHLERRRHLIGDAHAVRQPCARDVADDLAVALDPLAPDNLLGKQARLAETGLSRQVVPGDYVLREVEAPEGYALAGDVPFTVEETADVQAVTMEDEALPGPAAPDSPGGLLPQTGDSAWVIPAVCAVGALACVLGAVALGARRGTPRFPDDGEKR